MPKGIPVGTLAIGEDGAINAALLAAEIMAITNSSIKNSLKNWRSKQTKSVKSCLKIIIYIFCPKSPTWSIPSN